MSRECPSCMNMREEIEFVRFIGSPTGGQVTIRTSRCVRCINAEIEKLRKAAKRRSA